MGSDGTSNTVAATATTGGEWPASYPSPYQTYEAYGLIPETESAAGQGLPPMSSIRPNGTSTANSLPGQNTVTAFGQNNHGDGVKNLGVCLVLFKKPTWSFQIC